MYVALEGIDTAGKSTQIALLKEAFPQGIFTLEPGGSKLGVSLREILLEGEFSLSPRAEFLLFLSDRAEHCSKVLLPNRDKLIISDRSIISGIAYAKSLPLEEVVSLNLFATEGYKPDLVVLLELSKEELERRLGEKRQDSIELRGSEYLLEIQERMIRACERLGVRLLRVDASLQREQIHSQIKKELS